MIDEKLAGSVAYAYRQWREAILSRRCAEDVELKERESYETLLKRATSRARRSRRQSIEHPESVRTGIRTRV
jgi:hypothetical protein